MSRKATNDQGAAEIQIEPNDDDAADDLEFEEPVNDDDYEYKIEDEEEDEEDLEDDDVEDEEEEECFSNFGGSDTSGSHADVKREYKSYSIRKRSGPSELKRYKTQRGNDLLVYQGYDFVKHRENNAQHIVVWRCRSGKDCLGQLRTDRTCRRVIDSSAHSHPPMPNIESVHEAMTHARYLAVSTKLPPPSVYNQVVEKLPVEVVRKLPEKRLLVAMITRMRRVRGIDPRPSVRRRRRKMPTTKVHIYAYPPSKKRLSQSVGPLEEEPHHLNSTLKLLKTQRGQDMLWCSNYEYLKRYINRERGTIDWRCRSRTYCQGKLQTNISCTRVYRYVEHCHDPFNSLPSVHETVDRMRKMGSETTLTPRVIYKTCIAGLPMSVIEELPPLKSIREMIYRQRVSNSMSKKHPTSLKDIKFPTNIFGDTPPVVYDSGYSNGRRFYMFFTTISLKLLEEIPTWLMCETYKVKPRLFDQLYTIHVAINQTIVPCVYALMSHADVEDFVRVFGVLKNADTPLSPENVITDFQLNAQQAIKQVFPQVELYTCLSHLDEWLWKKVHEFGLREQYCKCKSTKQKTKLLLALAFVPQKELINAYNVIAGNVQEEDMKRLYSAFQRTFISASAGASSRRQTTAATTTAAAAASTPSTAEGSGGGASSAPTTPASTPATALVKPTFPVSMWNCHDMVSAGYLRVVNSFESWHTSLYLSLVPGSRNVYHIISKIGRELAQIGTYLPRLEQLERGSSLWWTTKVIRFDDQLNNVLVTFRTDTKTVEEKKAMIERYLKNVCCCIFLPTRQLSRRRSEQDVSTTRYMEYNCDVNAPLPSI